jgi:cardiolipin synthase
VYLPRGNARDLLFSRLLESRAGVGVSVLLDAAGAFFVPSEYVARMRRSGCHVAFFRPLRKWQITRLNHRTHRRILVIDGRVAFTGGFGISEQWAGNGRQPGHWRDTVVRIEGPVVRDLQAAFAQDWREATGIVLGGPAYLPVLERADSVAAEIVSSSALGGSFEVYTLFLLAIDAARRSIDITNPYFVPDPGLLHAKTVVIDGEWTTIGSTNFDNRSFALNEEVNATIYDRGIARRLERDFAEDLRYARQVSYEAWRHRGVMTRAREILTLPIRSQM